jgi:CheY-like chemotaxis protein
MKTVLVVDDSDVVLELAKKTLENAGYRVITRNKPSGSVAAILRDKPDIVLLDVNMPTLSGDTIAKILGRVSQNPETLVLLHSSLSIDNLRLKAIATGAHGYIQKTDSPTELVRRIEYWVTRTRSASSSRLEPAPAVTAAPTHASSGSGRFAAAPNVGGIAAAASGATSTSKIEGAPSATSGSAQSASSSGRFRAAAVALTNPPNSTSSSGSMAAVRAASSSGAFKAAPFVTDSAPAPGGTPTSRNMRAAKSTALGSDRPPKVLFVDDDWKMLSSYRTMVAGYLDAEFISSSDDAINRLLSDAPPEVVVCDIVMPGLSGADIYRRAVLLDRRWANRFIFVTGAASTPAVAEFLNTLDVRVFHKPVATDRLLRTLQQMTEVQRR